jgi:hypothetical protein
MCLRLAVSLPDRRKGACRRRSFGCWRSEMRVRDAEMRTLEAVVRAMEERATVPTMDGCSGSHGRRRVLRQWRELRRAFSADARKKKGAVVIFHARVLSVQRGLLVWPATQAKVVKMYHIGNTEGK